MSFTGCVVLRVHEQMARRILCCVRALVLVLAATTAGLFAFFASLPGHPYAAGGFRGPQRAAAALHPESQDVAAGKSYVLALSYMEQLTNAMDNFLSLGQVAGQDFSVTLVRPFVHGSRLFGLPNFLPDMPESVADGGSVAESGRDTTSIPLSTLVTMTEQRHCNGTVAAKFGEFLLHSHREIVLVHPVRRRYFGKDDSIKFKYFTELVHPSIRSRLITEQSPVFTCRHLLANFLLKLEDALNRLPGSEGRFKVVEAICFDGDSTVPLSASTLKHMAKRDYASYVWTHWGGTACLGMIASHDQGGQLQISVPRCNPSSSRLRIYPSSRSPASCFSRQRITALTPYVETLAEKYLHSRRLSITDATGLVAVHVRIEKLPRNAVKCCIRKLLQVIQALKKRTGYSSKLLLTTDMGPQGTQSCRGECSTFGARVHEFLKMYKLQPEFANPLDFGGPNSSGVAALVDLAALSSGETVVLVGGGQFQNSILLRALKSNSQRGKHRIKEVYSICSASTANLLKTEARLQDSQRPFVTIFTASECQKTTRTN